MTQDLLFSPVRIGSLELPGRLVKSATTETRSTDDGFVTDELIEYYEQIAWGRTPLLITGNAYYDLYSKAAPRQIGADDDDKMPVICVGGFLQREAMEEAIANGGCDMVSVARALIADPFLYRHTREGVQGPRCDFCNACFARGATWPVDFYNEEVRARKDEMLLAEPARTFHETS